ncbi:MAG: DUF4349 domain-containing protein [Planctomycetaceae bacterium]|nr:DUF4349 domain-containing protein [Planctomycetaceae bacterium]
MLNLPRFLCAHPMPSIVYGICLLLTVSTVGCGASDSHYGEYSTSYQAESPQSGDVYSSDESSNNISEQPVAELVEESAKPANEHLQKKLAQRKVVYTSDMHLEVKEFETAVDELRELIDEHQGFVASHNIDGGAGSRRSGHWKIRVPSLSFDSFHAGLKQLGYPLQDKLDSKEVTEEYVDVEHRIENLKRMEERLTDLLQKETKSLRDIFEVEKELARVNGEIERMQGRLELLKDMTSLATINLDISEEDVYEPPVVVAEVPPTFKERVTETFGTSAGTLVEMLQEIAIFVVALTPWLPFLVIFILLARYLIRKSVPTSVEA